MKKFLAFVTSLASFVPLLNFNTCLAANIRRVHFEPSQIIPSAPPLHSRCEEEYEYEEGKEEEDTTESEKLENNNCNVPKEYSSETEEDLFDCSNDSTDDDDIIDLNIIKLVASNSEIENFPVSDWDKEYNYDNIDLGDTFNISCLLI